MFRNRTVDAVAGRISRRRGRRCMTTGGAFTASTGNSCCGIGESFWNEASPTPMKREACGVLLARTGECSQARADSPWRVQSVADHAAAVRQGHAAGLAGILGRRPADGVAVLDRDPCARCTGKHIAANAPIFTCRARHHCCPVRGAVTKLLPPRAARSYGGGGCYRAKVEQKPDPVSNSPCGTTYLIFGCILRLAFFSACSKSAFVNGFSSKPESITAALSGFRRFAFFMALRRMSINSGL